MLDKHQLINFHQCTAAAISGESLPTKGIKIYDPVSHTLTQTNPISFMKPHGYISGMYGCYSVKPMICFSLDLFLFSTEIQNHKTTYNRETHNYNMMKLGVNTDAYAVQN